ncbi:MAG: ImmA/IrrE family metallo-endopeptidase [Pirellulales bacterium]|nr:ImmA/IrrE family metallo-endopeptidase [Pirellulales bacterium]
MTKSKSANPHLTAEREAEIGELAEFIAEDRFPQKRVEPAAIAKSVGIGVIPGYYDDQFDGMLEHDSDRFFIYCNLDRVESLTTPRARFTLAHELGHYYIPEHHNALKSGNVPKHPSHCDHESTNPIELEADHFASCLLMPSDRFRKRAKRVADGLEGIRQLAGEFGASLTSAAIRYAKLDVQKCVIIKWNTDGYGWKWLSPTAYAEGWRKTIEEPAKLVPDSATEKIVSGSSSGGDIVSTGTTAAHWFPFVSVGSYGDCLLKEEAVSLGRYGTLTLLSLAE